VNSTNQKSAPAVTPNLAAIAGHPTRLRSWFLLAERTMSPKEIAAEIKQDVGHVAYHVRVLLNWGAIELVRTEPRRGATEHWYRTVTRPDMRAEDMSGLSNEQVEKNASHIVQLQVADAAASFEAQLMVKRPEHSLIRCPGNFDAQAFEEASTLLDETLERLYEIQEACVERTTDSPGLRDIPAMAHLNLFEVPPTKERLPKAYPPNGGNE
jgi:hypothetical protein